MAFFDQIKEFAKAATVKSEEFAKTAAVKSEEFAKVAAVKSGEFAKVAAVKSGEFAKAAAVKSEEFAKAVEKKAETAMDMQKLSSDIDNKKHCIKDNYMQMGMEIYKKAVAGEEIPAYLQEYCKLIDITQAEIDELQSKIDMIKQSEFSASPAKIPCLHCGAEILSTSRFCPECGGFLKQEKATKKNTEAQNAVEDAPYEETAAKDETATPDNEAQTVINELQDYADVDIVSPAAADVKKTAADKNNEALEEEEEL